MAPRGHSWGALTNYYTTWLMYADKRGGLFVSKAIPHSQDGDTADDVSVTQVGCTCLWPLVLRLHSICWQPSNITGALQQVEQHALHKKNSLVSSQS